MNMKYEAIPQYESVDIAAKTVNTITGTIDRKPVGRALITTAAGFEGKHQVVNGDGVAIRSVQKIGTDNGEAATVELFVELVGGVKSLASYKFFAGYVAKNAENPECVDLFTDDTEKISRVVSTAERMCASHPECDSQWKLVDKDGTRYFLRVISTDLTATGRINNG